MALYCGIAASFPCAASAQTAATDAVMFGTRESLLSVDLSPDGKQIAYVAPTRGGSSVALTADLQTGKSTGFLRATGAGEQLSWCTFVTDDRLVCRYRTVRSENGVLIGFSRLVAVNKDGTQLKSLGQRASAYDANIRQADASIVDWLPGQGGEVLVNRNYVPEAGKPNTRIVRSKAGSGVDRVDTLTLASRVVEAPRRDVSGYFGDGLGNVRVIAINEENNDGLLTGRTKFQFRSPGSREWQTLSEYAAADQFQPLAVDSSRNAVYALKPLNGRQALYRITLADGIPSELVGSHPRVDIDEVVRSADGKSVIGYSFAEDKREVVYFDPDYKALAASLTQALPSLPLIRFEDASADGTKILLFAGSDSDPGRYYIFDKTAKQLNEVMLVRPELEKRTLASVKPVQVKGPDGVIIPAYLTLPPGKRVGTLPAVVLPHGGPSARDEWGFDWLAQFLAARGYAVLQPNYRGSTGFGDKWLVENGFKGWKTSIGDVAASARWMVSEGIADPTRIAVVGWSYGGYAALQSAVIDPAMFKAIVAIAPVTDLNLLKQEAEDFTTSRMMAEFVGSGPHLTEGSPLRRASEIRAPVLLVHGGKDQNVGINHSVRMEAELRGRGASVELLRFDDLDHSLSDSEARRMMLEKLDAILARTIGK